MRCKQREVAHARQNEQALLRLLNRNIASYEDRFSVFHRLLRHECQGTERHLHAPVVYGGRGQLCVQRAVLPHREKRPGGDTDAQPRQQPCRACRHGGGVVCRRLQVPAEPVAIEQLQHRRQYLTEPRPCHQALR